MDGRAAFDFVSDEFDSFTGYPAMEAATFESVVQHIHPDDRDKFLDNLRKLTANPQSMEMECRAYVN